MRKIIAAIVFIINFVIMVPLVIIWALAGFIASSIWALLEVLDGEIDGW